MGDHSFTTEPICPRCGHRERNAWEINFGPGVEGDTTHTCAHCSEEFFLERHVTVTYSSSPIERSEVARG